MIENVIVFSSLAFVVVFFTAWLFSPRLRIWLERPKYRFQANVQDYDQVQAGDQDKEQARKGEVRP